jgi:hypothetical protein
MWVAGADPSEGARALHRSCIVAAKLVRTDYQTLGGDLHWRGFWWVSRNRAKPVKTGDAKLSDFYFQLMG